MPWEFQHYPHLHFTIGFGAFLLVLEEIPINYHPQLQREPVQAYFQCLWLVSLLHRKLQFL